MPVLLISLLTSIKHQTKEKIDNTTFLLKENYIDSTIRKCVAKTANRKLKTD